MKYKYLLLVCMMNIALVSKSREMGNSAFGTHMAVLLTAVAQTKGPILELGCGDFSTPLLHAICEPIKRTLISTESHLEWMNYFTYLENEWHKFIFFTDKWAALPDFLIRPETQWSVVLVDHAPGERRAADIQILKNNADIFVVHDTEAACYGYEPVLSTFKYRYDYKIYSVWTTIVSDVIDVATWFKM